MSHFKNSRICDLKYLRFIAENMPCIINGYWDDTVVGHHSRIGQSSGIGLKCPDDCVIPISYENHMKLHAMGSELKFFKEHGVNNPHAIGKELYRLYKLNEIWPMQELILSKGINL